jgi:putative salt-induced outer membrane protein
MNILILLLLISYSLYAGEFNTHTELSYTDTSGNSETQTFSLKSDISAKMDENLTLKGKVNILYVSDHRSNEIANKKYIELEYNHKLSDRLFSFVKSNYTNDKFSGYNYQLNVGPGLGYRVIKSRKHNVNFSLSLQYSEDSPEQNEIETYSSTEAGIKYIWKIESKLTFKQDGSYQTSNEERDNYFTKAVSSVEYQLNDNLSLGTSYSVNYQNVAPAGAEKFDRIFLTSLIIDY